MEALYDRLELKVVTQNVEDRDKRLAVLRDKQAGRAGQIAASITLDELKLMQEEVSNIPVPDSINELADDILCQLRKDEISVSDRKYLNYYPIAQAKGRMAIVSGRLQIRNWTDKEGNKRRSAEIVAENIYFGDSKAKEDQEPPISAGGPAERAGGSDFDLPPGFTPDFSEMTGNYADGDLPF